MELINYHCFHITMKLFGNHVNIKVAKGWRPSDESLSIKLRHVQNQTILKLAERVIFTELIAELKGLPVSTEPHNISSELAMAEFLRGTRQVEKETINPFVNATQDILTEEANNIKLAVFSFPLISISCHGKIVPWWRSCSRSGPPAYCFVSNC
ncbi:hypothetical protein EDD85DRAFT_951923 [Armillaria nabsnona]|nr:hypothetical protein EDD85DRAFT_951923 [Armillaria nabsnona]